MSEYASPSPSTEPDLDNEQMSKKIDNVYLQRWDQRSLIADNRGDGGLCTNYVYRRFRCF